MILNYIQTETNIALTEVLSDFFSNARGQIIWSLKTIQPINVEEEAYQGRVKVNINGINDTKQPFYITEQQSIDLGGPVHKLAPQNDFLFHCIGDTTTNQSLEFDLIYNEDSNKVEVKQISNDFVGDDGSSYYVEPHAFESGGKPYREPLMRFDVIKKDVQKSIANYLSDFMNIDDFTINLPKEKTFINPQDKKSIDSLVDSIESGINTAKKLRQFTSELSEQELSKKPTDDDRPDIKYVIDNVKDGVEAIEQYASSHTIFVKVSRIRSPKIKRMLGQSANSYFSPIDEILTRIKGHLTSYTSLRGASKDDLQKEHQEFCNVFIENLKLLEINLQHLQAAYESAIEE